MDFDLSKENIQPLRGGRNASQLEIALQAQTNEEFQRELLHQKEQFELAIQNYEGDDPLENWFHYISWVEQSYPKHGHEGNLVPLLEDCLAKFEFDKRYTNDFRFCKLWIKYNDLQQNPIELYHMMHARGLCVGCADLYRAWAYYHEAAGDYRSADVVFQTGKRALAQPYEELLTAHESMIYAAGQQLISGVNEQRLVEQRRVLTTLRTYKPGKVGSIRSASSSGAGVLPCATSTCRPNVAIPIFEDKSDMPRGAEAAPVSILSVARRQIAPKENTIKPGVWAGVSLQCKGSGVHREPKFIVHEDDSTESEPQGLKLPAEYYPVTHEDFSHWKPVLCYAEPEDPSRIPMYPKAKVYSSSETEYSLEEIRACRYLARLSNRLNVSHIETEQAIQSILGDDTNISKQAAHSFSQVDGRLYSDEANAYQQPGCEQDNVNVYQHEQVVFHTDEYQQVCSESYSPHPQQSIHYVNVSQAQENHAQPPQEHFVNMSQGYQTNLFQQSQQQNISHHTVIQHEDYPAEQAEKMSSRVFGQNMSEDATTSFHSASMGQHKNVSNESILNYVGDDMNVLWRSSNDSLNESVHQPKPHISKFAIYEESNIQETLQPKGSAMKTMPFKILSDEELAETGSRGGHDIAAAAQPSDGAKRIEIFEDDSSSSYTESVPASARFPELNASCNTQIFNFNLNAMQVSTPQPKRMPLAYDHSYSSEDAEMVRKHLFEAEGEKNRMSTIYEETTKNCVSSSGGSSTSFKMTTLSQSKRENKLAIEGNNYHNNLAQNLKANAALRTSLLEMMECESGQSSPVIENTVTPLEQAPSDPFKLTLLRSLLDRVGFPGQHTEGYIRIFGTPRIASRKEVTYIGDDPYYVLKELGQGTYGHVFKAVDAKTNRTVALKMQKPPNCWEFYICRELQVRLAKHHLKDCFMNIHTAYFSDQISVFVSEFSPCGSLLDVANNFKQKSGYLLKQPLCVHLCIEMLKIISAMHQVRIIHADIKPDNFLVYVIGDGTLQLQLIDFGCSIDMTFFPPDTTFTRRVTTKDFICCEMQDGRPWSYHTDLFCVAATAHVLLFDKYMQLQKKGDQWSITQRFTRYMRVDLWNTFFSSLLNQQKGPADPEKLITFMTKALHTLDSDVGAEMRKLINIINNR